MTVKIAARMARHRNYRMAAVEATPNPLFIKIYETLSGNDIEPYNEYYRLWAYGTTYGIPRPKDALRLTHIGDSPLHRVYQKYTYGDDVRVERGDYVVDVGAFIGEYSMQALNYTEDVLAIEPDPKSVKCLAYNLPQYTGIRNAAVHNEEAYQDFHAGVDHAESGLLTPDDGQERSVFELRTERLDSILNRTPDLLKVEAEGCEPEVLDSLGDIRPKKIAVNVSPERDGESPSGEVGEWLINNGYKIAEDGGVMFGWKI